VLFFDAKPAREQPWTEALWVCDLRTNMHFTLKQNTLKRADLDEFVACFKPERRRDREETWGESNPEGRWRRFGCEEILRRDKFNLDVLWLKDESLQDAEDLPEPDVIALEIVEDLQAALEEFQARSEAPLPLQVRALGAEHGLRGLLTSSSGMNFG